MTITTDGALGATGIVLSLLVGFSVWLFSLPMRQKLQDVSKQLADLREKYNELILEYWRVVAENEWLRRQLRKRDIQIPPLPDDLKPRMDSHGNVTIMVSERVGVQVAGDQLRVGQDIVGGNKAVREGEG